MLKTSYVRGKFNRTST